MFPGKMRIIVTAVLGLMKVVLALFSAFTGFTFPFRSNSGCARLTVPYLCQNIVKWNMWYGVCRQIFAGLLHEVAIQPALEYFHFIMLAGLKRLATLGD